MSTIESLLEDVRHGRQSMIDVHDEIIQLMREFAAAQPTPTSLLEVYQMVDDFPGLDGPNDPAQINTYAYLGWISKADIELLDDPRPIDEILAARTG
jgi:hypothetical protein